MSDSRNNQLALNNHDSDLPTSGNDDNVEERKAVGKKNRRKRRKKKTKSKKRGKRAKKQEDISRRLGKGGDEEEMNDSSPSSFSDTTSEESPDYPSNTTSTDETDTDTTSEDEGEDLTEEFELKRAERRNARKLRKKKRPKKKRKKPRKRFRERNKVRHQASLLGKGDEKSREKCHVQQRLQTAEEKEKARKEKLVADYEVSCEDASTEIYSGEKLDELSRRWRPTTEKYSQLGFKSGTIVTGGFCGQSEGLLECWAFNNDHLTKLERQLPSNSHTISSAQSLEGSSTPSFVVGCTDGILREYSLLKSGEKRQIVLKRVLLGHHSNSMKDLDYCSRKKLLISCSHDHTTKLWDMRESSDNSENLRKTTKMSYLHSFPIRGGYVDSCIFLGQDRNVIATSSSVGNIVFHDYEKLEVVRNLQFYHGRGRIWSIRGLGYDETTGLMFSCSIDRSVKGYDFRKKGGTEVWKKTNERNFRYVRLEVLEKGELVVVEGEHRSAVMFQKLDLRNGKVKEDWGWKKHYQVEDVCIAKTGSDYCLCSANRWGEVHVAELKKKKKSEERLRYRVVCKNSLYAICFVPGT